MSYRAVALARTAGCRRARGPALANVPRAARECARGTSATIMGDAMTYHRRAVRTLLLAVSALLMVGGSARASEPPRSRVLVTQTSADLSQAMRSLPPRRFSPTVRIARGVRVIDVDDTLRYQRFIGAGGGMTDSSAWLIWTQLAPAQRSRLMRLLFAVSGAHLSFLRVPIGASDYTADGVPYSYDDEPVGQTDPRLTDFSVAHDQPYILPALRFAQYLNPTLYLEGVPWSAPGWMKANDALDDHDHAGTLLPRDDAVFGRYLAAFVRAYRNQGVRVKGLAVQDEPNEPNPYPGMQLTLPQEADLVARDIRPALRSAGLAVNVFGWDLSWGPPNAVGPLIDEARNGTLTGLAWHCYAGTPQFMSSAHRVAPRALQIVDECSSGSADAFATSELLISATRNWANAVALWNLALLPQGGPAQALGYGCEACTGVVSVDPQTGQYALSRDYYELAQFSRFIPPGAVRVSSPHFVSYGLRDYKTVVSSGLDDVAFLDPDGTRVLFAYNTGPTAVSFAVRWDRSAFTYRIPPHATTTLRWR
jgi:glucosylceramidase